MQTDNSPIIAVDEENYKENQSPNNQNLVSEVIKTRSRTFFLDLRESSNGFYVKISEKSKGQKSTIFMDQEDLQEFIQKLQTIQEHLKEKENLQSQDLA